MARREGYGTAVSARDLSIEYRATGSRPRHVAVRGVSFDLFEGETLGVIGDSGSGKSTLAALVAGPIAIGAPTDRTPRISGGTLSVFDAPVRRNGTRADAAGGIRVGYLAQDAAQELDARLTVAENVAEPIFARDRRFDAKEAGQAAATLVDAVHLPLSVLGRRPHELSSGQRQRVALARSLILEPELFVADEPIRGVDVMVRHDVLDVIPELQAARGFAAIVVSSELGVVTRVAERVAVLHDGVVIGIGPLADLVDEPVHPYLKSLARTLDDQPG